MDTTEGATFGVAYCDFSESVEKPWEVGFKIGDVLKLIDCVEKNCWKVEVNGRQGYVTLVKLEVRKSQFEQLGLAQQENNDQVTPQVNTSKRTREEEANSHTDESSQAGSVRRSARVEASTAKRLKTKLNEPQRLEVTREEEEPQDRAKNDAKTTKVNKDGCLVPGPRDIVKSVGLNKVSVFPYEEAVFKIEKVDPPHEESESSCSDTDVVQDATCSVPSLQLTPDPTAPSVPLMSHEVSIVELDSTQANQKISERMFVTRSVKEEFDLEDAELLRLTKEIIPGFRPKEPSPVPTVACVEVSPTLETAIFDNSVNVCCVLFAQVWEILVNVCYQRCFNDILKNSPNEVLKLRLVCQNWRTVIDKFYENLSCHAGSVSNNGVQSNISGLNPSSRNLFQEVAGKKNPKCSKAVLPFVPGLNHLECLNFELVPAETVETFLTGNDQTATRFDKISQPSRGPGSRTKIEDRTCQFCGKIFTAATSARRHINVSCKKRPAKEDEDISSRTCSICGKVCSRGDNLVRHFRTAHQSAEG